MAEYDIPKLTAGKLDPGVLPDLTEAVHDIVAALLVAGTGTTVTYDDAAGTVTITATGGGGSTDPEIVRDVIGAALVAGPGVQITLNDAADTITIASTAVLPTRQVIAGTGLTGGGDLSANRTLSVTYGTTAGTAAQGNDPRLSDARTPTAHSHPIADLPAGTTLYTSSSTTRPTARTDVLVIWTGADPTSNALAGDLWIAS